MGQAPQLILSNGVGMPALGLGVFLSPAEETAAAVESAITTGYRLIDTAAAYRNERQVGEGMRSAGVARQDIFVTTKLWITQYGYEDAKRALDASLRRLGLDYLDLYLLHWPLPSDFEATLASWRAMEEMLDRGLVRAIGVSNFSAHHLDALMARSRVMPMVNQVELHPFFIQSELRAANATRGIVTQSWSPIGGAMIRRPHLAPAGMASEMDHPLVRDLAQTHGRTPAQILLRWHIQHGLCAIPKSVNPARIAENFDIFGFTLNEAELAAIDALDTGRRSSADPDQVDRTINTIDIDAQ